MASVNGELQTWRGRTVLVTGHTGFKGAWLCGLLHRLGAVVCGVALDPPTNPSVYDQVGLSKVLSKDLRLDLGNERDLSACLVETKASFVFHLAAQALVRVSYLRPVETWHSNVTGTIHLLDGILHAPEVKGCLVVTSDKCYRNDGSGTPCHESFPLGGNDPYSSSKAAVELLVESYRHSYYTPRGLPLATARAGNVLGGGDRAQDRLLPDAIRSMEAGVPLRLRNPGSVRPWQHVLDPLMGYLLLGARLLGSEGMTFGRSWNFGPKDNQALKASEIVEDFFSHLGEGSWEIDHPEGNNFSEERFLSLDASLAREKLGWISLRNVHEGIESTARWFQAEKTGANLTRHFYNQIDEYLISFQKGCHELS
jgi:CDP-glucose 4,6-dehydratase